jgi:hypothetical protein
MKMPYKEELIQFNIVNNTTDCVIDVPLFSESAPSINATTKYQWQIITADLSCGCWSIIINSQTYFINFDGTLIGLQNAFNNLGFGFACTTTIGADTFLYTLDNTNIYGAIETCYCITTSTTTTTTTLPITTTTTTTTTTIAPTTTTTTTTTSTTTTTTTLPITTTTTTTTTTTAPVPYTIDSFGTGSSFDACTTGSPTISVYALSGYTTPIVGMIFYDSPTLTTPFVGGAGWRKFTNGVTDYAGEVDINGELTNYVTCASITTTTTTTTTTLPITTTTTTSTTTLPIIPTTSTTTTTTTILLANVNISNTFFAGTIDDVQVNGISIVGATFPLPIGNGTTGTTNQIGTYSIVVFYSNVTLSSHIDCIDSNSNTSCTNMIGGGSVIFTNQVIDGIVDVNITSADSNC